MDIKEPRQRKPDSVEQDNQAKKPKEPTTGSDERENRPIDQPSGLSGGLGGGNGR